MPDSLKPFTLLVLTEIFKTNCRFLKNQDFCVVSSFKDALNRFYTFWYYWKFNFATFSKPTKTRNTRVPGNRFPKESNIFQKKWVPKRIKHIPNEFLVASLEFRYSTASAIDLISNFDNRIIIANLTTVFQPGLTQTLPTPQLLTDNTQYFVAARAMDIAGNRGQISNVAFMQINGRKTGSTPSKTTTTPSKTNTTPYIYYPSDDGSGGSISVFAWLSPLIVIVLAISGCGTYCWRRIKRQRIHATRTRHVPMTIIQSPPAAVQLQPPPPQQVHVIHHHVVDETGRETGDKSHSSGFGSHSGAAAGSSSGDHQRDGKKAKLPTSIGDYKILKLLGGGAFGSVYLCYDNVTGRQFACKRLKALEKLNDMPFEGTQLGLVSSL